MRKQVKITTPEELKQFIKDTNFTFDQYLDIICKFYNKRFIMFTGQEVDLIEFIDRCEHFKEEYNRLPTTIYQKKLMKNIKDLV